MAQARAADAVPLDADQPARADPELGAAAATLGHTNTCLDRDGAARFEFPAIPYGDEYYPSFALEVARQHLGVAREDVQLVLGRGIGLGARWIPTDDRTRFVVNYRGPESLPDVQLCASCWPARLPAADGSRARWC